MAKKISYNPIENIHEDWTLDERNGFPYSGKSVQEFIKKTLNEKGGEFYYDSDTTKYLIFADAESRDLYLSDREEHADLLLGSFDAPANYTAEINMITPSTNIVLSGTKGCYIDFTFDVKSKSGSSTGEGVVATFTFNNAGNTKKVTQIYSAGTNVHFLADAYLEDGSNSISVVITGRNTLVSAMAAVNYTVVALQFTSSFDFSKCIISGDYIGIPYYLEGAGVKYVEWYIDGVQLQDVDTISDLKVNRIKSISTSGMSEGKHNVQARAYITSSSDNFYSKTLYFDFVVAPVDEVWQSNVTFVLLGLTLDEPTHSTVSVAAEQYTDFYYKAAVYDSRKRSLEMIVSDNGTQVQSITMYADEIQSLSYFPASVGLHILTFTADGATAVINMDVAVGEVDIQEATEGIALKLSAKGRSNGETNPGTWDYENIHTTFRGFSSWNEQSGWVNDALVIPVGASIEVGFEPLIGNAITTGKTIEIDFEAVNITDDNAEIMSIENPDTHAGLKLTASTAKLLSRGGTAVDTKYRDGDRIHLTFIINKTTGDDARMMYIVNNGILERAAQFAASDSFNAPGNIIIGSDGCVIRVYSIRVYNRALDVDEAFCNYAVDSPNLINIASNNDIYDKDSGNISVDKVSAHIPVMIITGNIDYILAINDKAHKNDWNTNPVQIEFRDMQNPERNFFLDDADIRLQGTSSISYPRKNFRIYSISKSGKYNTKLYSPTHNEDDLITSGKYSFKPRAAAVSCWCLKADYAESSGSHNTGVARFWNKRMYDTIMNNGTHPLRTMAQAWALEHNYPYDVRTTIDGFPIVLFQRNDENSPLTCFGQYNFNNDKSTEDVFGFTALTVEDEQGHTESFDNSHVECWEVLDSDNTIALFTDVTNFDTKWDDAFEARYPDKNTNVTALKRVSEWINSCYLGMDGETMQLDLAEWRVNKADYFDLPKLAAYYVYLLRFGAVDQTVKNAMFTTEDGQHWFYINYDNDTILGIDNASHLFDTWDYGLKSKTPSGGYYYAGKGMSVLWNLFEADSECLALARQIDERLFAAGLNYEQICEMFDNEQSGKWCERIYNANGRYKYIEQALLGQNVLYMLQGSRKSHRHWWLFHRLEKYDNEFGNGTYTRRNIQVRATSDKNIPEGATYTFVPAINSNFGYGVASTIVDAPTAREAGVEYTSTGLPQATGVGNLIYIYNANNLNTLDVSGYITAMAVLDVSAAVDVNGNSFLRKLILGDGETDNIYLSAISGISVMKDLEELDIRGYKAITHMEFVNLPNLHKLYAADSGLTSFTAADGSVFTEITLPETIQSMSFNSSTINNMTCTANKTLVSFSIRNIQGNWNAKSFVNTWLALFTDSELENVELTLVGINWTGMTADQVLRFAKTGTHTLQGKVTLTSLNYEQYQQILEAYGSNVFDPNGTFVIDAPDGIYFEAPQSITEGQEITLNAIAFPVGNPIVYHLFDSSDAEIYPVSGIATYNGVTLNVNTGVLSVGTISEDFTIKLRAVSGESFSELQPCLVRDISTIEGFTISGSTEFTTTGSHELTIVPTNPNYNVPIQSIEVQAQSMSELLSFTYDVSHLKINVNVSAIPSATIEQYCNIVVTDELGNVFRQDSVELEIQVIRVNDFTVSGPVTIVSKGTQRYNITDLLPANHNKDIASVNVTASPSQGLVITGNTAAGFNLVVTSMPDYTTDVTLTVIATLDNNTTVTKTKVVTLKVVSNIDVLDELGVAIMHVDGSFYTLEQWQAGGFTNADANGVAASAMRQGQKRRMVFSKILPNGTDENSYVFPDGTAGRLYSYDDDGSATYTSVSRTIQQYLNLICGTSYTDLNLYVWYLDARRAYNMTIIGFPSVPVPIISVCEPRSVAMNKPIDLGLPSGKLWSNVNLGAASIEDAGLYYQWGNLDGHNGEDGYDFSTTHYAETPGSQIATKLPIANDAANDALGGQWRIPTAADFAELFNSNYTTRVWTTVNGVSGWRITSIANGNSIFMPVVGYIDDTGFHNKTTNGYYWSSDSYNNTAGMGAFLAFNQSNADWTSGHGGSWGQAIRPILYTPYLSGDSRISDGTHNYTIENLDDIASISASVSTPSSGTISVATSGTTTVALTITEAPSATQDVTLTVVATLTNGDTVTLTKVVTIAVVRVIMTSVTNPQVLAVCYAQGWCADSTKMTEEEAAAVTSIGTVFRSNRNITHFEELEYFTGLTRILGYAFYDCVGLTAITIPEGVTNIETNAFRNCSSLTSITIPNGVTAIGSDAFNSCINLASVTLPSGVTEIGAYAFQNCRSLTSINIPSSVTSIGAYAFQNCRSLTSVTISNGVTAIGSDAFNGCANLTYITIPNSVTSIETNAFIDCTSLTSITIPNGVTNIGSNTFAGCTSLTAITIPSSVTSIGNYAFQGCSSLGSIEVDANNSVYDSRNNCNAIIRTLDNTLVCGCKNTTIPSSVTSIGAYAFQNCTSLTAITIPSSVTSIGNYAFYRCSGLTSVTIPNSVTSIAACSFSVCTGLTSVTISNGVTDIGSNTFAGCTSLTAITIPSSVTSIGAYAFQNCSSLTSINIPNGVTAIGSDTFNGCTSLASVTIPNSVTNIGDYAFYNCTSLTAITIPDDVATIGSYTFYNCKKLSDITCLATAAPTIQSSTFTNVGTDASVTTKTLNVPTGATGYDSGQWQTQLINKGFTLNATL